MPTFLVVGESLVDLVGEPGSWRFQAAPGGSPLNVAVGLATAGHQVRLATELGEDLFGQLVRGHLAGHGVALAGPTGTGPTGLAVTAVDPAGEAAGYDFRLAWGWSGPADLTGVDCLHVGSLGALLAPGAAAVRATVTAARGRGVPVSYDPNVRPARLGPDAPARIEHLVEAADLVKVSSDDLSWLYPGILATEAAARWAGRGPRLVVLTRGAAGAVAFTADGYAVECPAPPVTVVDTIGAGDAFTAGLLSGLAAAGALRSPTRAAVTGALAQAVAAAAAACARRGATPPPPERADLS